VFRLFSWRFSSLSFFLFSSCFTISGKKIPCGLFPGNSPNSPHPAGKNVRPGPGTGFAGSGRRLPGWDENTKCGCPGPGRIVTGTGNEKEKSIASIFIF
ncbi:MAG: hypothetical protein PUF76_09790, partial [bacterium]|nr:hypothetical protein [bacterium]